MEFEYSGLTFFGEFFEILRNYNFLEFGEVSRRFMIEKLGTLGTHTFGKRHQNCITSSALKSCKRFKVVGSM